MSMLALIQIDADGSIACLFSRRETARVFWKHFGVLGIFDNFAKRLFQYIFYVDLRQAPGTSCFDSKAREKLTISIIFSLRQSVRST